jgi:hypothetical protein
LLGRRNYNDYEMGEVPVPENGPEAEVLAALKEQNALLRRWIRDNNNWGLILARGMVLGLGTAIGATVILSLAIWALRPLRAIEPFRAAVDRAVETLHRLEKTRRGDPVEGADEAVPERTQGSTPRSGGSN